MLRQPRVGVEGVDVDRVTGDVGRGLGRRDPAGGLGLGAVVGDRLVEQLLLVLGGAPAAREGERQLVGVVRGGPERLQQGGVRLAAYLDWLFADPAVAAR